jgi:hypothetical protein
VLKYVRRFGKNQKLQFPNFAKNYLTPRKGGGIISLALIGELVKCSRCESIQGTGDLSILGAFSSGG